MNNLIMLLIGIIIGLASGILISLVGLENKEINEINQRKVNKNYIVSPIFPNKEMEEQYFKQWLEFENKYKEGKE